MTPEELSAKAAADAVTANRAADDARVKAEQAANARREAQQKAEDDALLKEPVVIHGRAGGAFSIDGPGLGSSGTLIIGGQVIPTTRWDDRSIRGTLPVGTQGAIRLQTQKGERHGTFPTPRVQVTKTTTTVETQVVPAGSPAATLPTVPVTGQTPTATTPETPKK